MATAPTVRAGTTNSGAPNNNGNGEQRPVAPVPFTRAARRKSMQADTATYSLAAASTIPARPIELPAAGFLRYIELQIDVAVTGNAATVAAPGGALDFPFNVINSIQVTNAAGDSITVPISGYELFLINKYGGNWESPQSDPRNDPSFVPVTAGSGADGGSFSIRLKFPFEQDPRDAFCALPNLAANKAYQVVIQYASINGMFAGGTAPDGDATLTQTVVAHYWSQPQTTSGTGQPQQTAPIGNGSVSLYRRQQDSISAGSRIMNLYNVGNMIRWGVFTVRDDSTPSVRSDADFPDVSYLRLNNDQLFYKTRDAWRSEMYERYGFEAGSLDTAGNQDTGVYVLSDFMAQHEYVTPDGPRDQYLITLDSTLFQYEANSFGTDANSFSYLQNELKPKDAQSVYNLNIV